MTASLIFLHIAGAVCLLLWGTRMVKLGFSRAYGTSMRSIIAKGTQNRVKACASGIGVTMLLQSATATTLLLISFTKTNTIPLAAALAVIIGADISTTLVAQILTMDMSWLSPSLLVIGVSGHLIFEHGGRKKHICRVLIGLGLMLLSLSLIKHASTPLSQSQILPLIMGPLEKDFITAIFVAAILTWVMHSSLAAVLLFATLAANNIVDLQLGAYLILGANLGGAFIAFAVTYKDGLAARRITIGNIVMRCFMVIIGIIFLPQILEFMTGYIATDNARHMINLHTGFNIALALVFMPTVHLLAGLIEKILPEPTQKATNPHDPLYLDEKSLGTPVIALACAAREALRMAEMVEAMMAKTIQSFEQNTDKMIKDIRKQDDAVDTLYRAIKFYLARLTQEALDPKEADRYLQILSFSTNLEHVGDIIDKSLIELAEKKMRLKERFSNDGWEEIKGIHNQIMENIKLSQNLFLSEDPALARRLIDSKKDVRLAAEATAAEHFKRLRAGLPETIGTSAIHLDVIRDYKRINSLITTVAYSILENAEKYAKKRRKH
ncbi:MAG: Na/Pi cotransporter family protein [Bdellovibrionales bacterium]